MVAEKKDETVHGIYFDSDREAICGDQRYEQNATWVTKEQIKTTLYAAMINCERCVTQIRENLRSKFKPVA
jgi:hypothetical protein